MSAPSSSMFLDGEDILASEIDPNANTMILQLGDVVSGQVTSQGAVMIQHCGFISRPPNAVDGKAACQAWGIRQSDRDVVFGTRDLRGAALQGNCGAGEVCLYGAGANGKSQGRIVIKDGGAISLMTTADNTVDGASVFMRIAPTGITFGAPWGRIVFDATGFHVLINGGASFDLGALTGLPIPSLSTYATLKAGLVSVDSPAVALGPSGGALLPAAMGATPGLPTVPLQPLVTSTSVTIGV